MKVKIMNKINEVLITTNNIVLKAISSLDEKDLVGLLGNSEVMRYSLNGTLNYEKAKQVLNDMIHQREKFGFGICSIFHKLTKQWIGFCGLYLDDLDGKLNTDLAYRILPEFWGKGYATEAVMSYLSYIRKNFSAVTINAYIQPGNIASIRVAEKAGLKFIKDTCYHNISVYLYRLTDVEQKNG